MSWRVARALLVLRAEVDASAPGRSKASDGTIGDAAHSARRSDHNPNKAGVVCALDLTHHPVGEHFDAHAFADWLRLRCRRGLEHRVAYLISNGRIASTVQAWEWRVYTGNNPHRSHVHVSVRQDVRRWDDASPWGWSTPATSSGTATRPMLRRTTPLTRGPAVLELQERLNALDATDAKGKRLKVDGAFGIRTDEAVRTFQQAQQITIDGIVGPATWSRLGV